MNKTIKALIFDISSSNKLKKAIFSNMLEESKNEMIFNLVELRFNFKDKTVEVLYYVVDKEFPNTKLSYSELEELLNY